MKTILKVIIRLLIVLVLLIVIPIGTLYFMISDSKDEAPTELYAENITLQGEIDSLFSRFLVNREGAFYLTFSEEELDKLAFAFIRSINSSYYAGCGSDECKYIVSQEIPEEVPLISGKKVHLRHLYTEVGSDRLDVHLTASVPFLKTSLNIGFNFEKENGTYVFMIDNLALGKLNVMSGLGKKIAQPLLSGIGFSEESINQFFEKQNLPLVFSMDDYSIRFEKEALGDVIMKFVNEENKPESKLFREMIAILSSSENDLLDLGFFDLEDESHFGFKIDLNELKTTPEQAELLAAKRSQAAKGFDADSFVTNKTQTFLIGSLASAGSEKITFTNQDFNRIIYSQTNGYSEFKFSMLPGEEPNFRMTGVFVEFSQDAVDFQFVVEINGVEVLIIVSGAVENNEGESELTISLDEEMSIGGINAESEFLLELLSSLNIAAIGYDSESGEFKINVETFKELMGVGGPETPLEIEKIKAASGGIEVYVQYTDPELASQISQARKDVEELLKTDFVDESQFDTSDSEQAELVQELLDSLNEISETLNDPEAELDSETTDNLIAIVNGLSDENQQILLDQISENANSSDLENLYKLLFGN